MSAVDRSGPVSSPESLNHATSGMNPDPGATLKQARKSTNGRRFFYDGGNAPTCLKCGMVRENRHGMRCDRCLRLAAA